MPCGSLLCLCWMSCIATATKGSDRVHEKDVYVSTLTPKTPIPQIIYHGKRTNDDPVYCANISLEKMQVGVLEEQQWFVSHDEHNCLMHALHGT